jgi:biotin operon repressor
MMQYEREKMMDDETGQHPDVLRAMERFAVLLADAGMPRMPSRLFAYLLAADADDHTAAELAAGLQVSPAAISGAVRYLQHVGFVVRGREPGTRLDHYRLRDDLWYEMYTSRVALLISWEKVLGEAADLLEPGSAGVARLHESQEFIAFVRADLPALMERWRQHRNSRFPP